MSDTQPITSKTRPKLRLPPGYEIWWNHHDSFDLVYPDGDFLLCCATVERAVLVAREHARKRFWRGLFGG